MKKVYCEKAFHTDILVFWDENENIGVVKTTHRNFKDVTSSQVKIFDRDKFDTDYPTLRTMAYTEYMTPFPLIKMIVMNFELVSSKLSGYYRDATDEETQDFYAE